VTIRVILADDHPVVLAGMRSLLNGEPEIELVGDASTGPTALDLIRDATPDVAVIDISMPGYTGLELARVASLRHPEVKLLALTVHEDRAYLQPMLQAGVRGYLLKRSAGDELARAIRAVAAGGMYLDPAVAEKAVSDPAPPDNLNAAPQELSPREINVLRMTAQGFSNKEIAGKLNVSVKSVETYKARATDKLGLRNRAAIVRYGASQGWLNDDQDGYGTNPGSGPESP
jgi:DNA-binding NarL/FixJ family response regulator